MTGQIRYADSVQTYQQLQLHEKNPSGKCADCGDPIKDTDRIKRLDGVYKSQKNACSHLWCWGKKPGNLDKFHKECFVEYDEETLPRSPVETKKHTPSFSWSDMQSIDIGSMPFDEESAPHPEVPMSSGAQAKKKAASNTCCQIALPLFVLLGGIAIAAFLNANVQNQFFNQVKFD